MIVEYILRGLVVLYVLVALALVLLAAYWLLTGIWWVVCQVVDYPFRSFGRSFSRWLGSRRPRWKP